MTTTQAITHAEGVQIIHRIRREQGFWVLSEGTGHRAGGDIPDGLGIGPTGYVVNDEWKCSPQDLYADRAKWEPSGRPGETFSIWSAAGVIDLDDPNLPAFAGLYWIHPDERMEVLREPRPNPKRDVRREHQLTRKALIDLERASGRTANEAKASNRNTLSGEQERRMIGLLDPKEWQRLTSVRKLANVGLATCQQIKPKQASDWANTCAKVETTGGDGEPTYIRLKANTDD